jgi:hypothetical protein
MGMREENEGKFEPLGRPKMITLHWTAGSYTQTFDHYHFNIKGDGTVVQTLSITHKGSHTWKRNSNNIGVSMCCMAGWKLLPKKEQLEKTARTVAELMGIYGIGIDQVKDHFYYAKIDGYPKLRQDVDAYMEKLYPMIMSYRAKLISGEIKNSLQGKIW